MRSSLSVSVSDMSPTIRTMSVALALYSTIESSGENQQTCVWGPEPLRCVEQACTALQRERADNTHENNGESEVLLPRIVAHIDHLYASIHYLKRMRVFRRPTSSTPAGDPRH